tara:strand:- start:13 stop:387 length:375 start_codon:yes stop_codon:yes gene_type:complete
MSYEKYHILDFCIEDEQLTNNDREVSIFVDTLGMFNIELGHSMTIRTDEAGVDDLRHALHQALTKLDDIRYEQANDRMDKITEEMNPVTPAASAVVAPNIIGDRSESQSVDPFNPVLADDPLRW